MDSEIFARKTKDRLPSAATSVVEPFKSKSSERREDEYVKDFEEAIK